MKPVYHLSDLHDSLALKKPAILAVIGNPVSHSASPFLHQPVLDHYGIQGSYIRLKLEAGELLEAFNQMAAAGFKGCNVTVPYKLEALNACDEITESAQRLGAVNTITFRNGKIIGHNTDGPGIIEAIHDSFALDPAKIVTMIIGAGGGAGQAIATQISSLNPPKLILVNRSVDKIQQLRKSLLEFTKKLQIELLSLDELRDMNVKSEAQLIIQTSSLGLKKEDPKIVPDNFFHSSQKVYDTIYQPPLTPFLESAKKANCEFENGLSLLIHQGALAFEEWFPGTEPLSVMKKAAKAVYP